MDRLYTNEQAGQHRLEQIPNVRPRLPDHLSTIAGARAVRSMAARRGFGVRACSVHVNRQGALALRFNL